MVYSNNNKTLKKKKIQGQTLGDSQTLSAYRAQCCRESDIP